MNGATDLGEKEGGGPQTDHRFDGHSGGLQDGIQRRQADGGLRRHDEFKTVIYF